MEKIKKLNPYFATFTKVNSGRLQVFNVKCKTLKLLGRNMKVYLHDLGDGEWFLKQEMKSTNYQGKDRSGLRRNRRNSRPGCLHRREASGGPGRAGRTLCQAQGAFHPLCDLDVGWSLNTLLNILKYSCIWPCYHSKHYVDPYWKNILTIFLALSKMTRTTMNCLV